VRNEFRITIKSTFKNTKVNITYKWVDNNVIEED